jgi:hypothetical protein
LVVVILLGTYSGRVVAAPGADEAPRSNASVNGGGVLDVSLNDLVATANLHIDGPVPRSEAGLPIGNGRMGTLVWTTPSAVKMQINRVDVFGNNKDSESFPERHTDYCGGCTFVIVDLGGEAFTERMKQRLSCNDGLATLEGEGVRVRALAWMDRDVIALEVTDERATPAPITVRLRMLRPPVVRHFKQTAASKLDSRDDRLLLTQVFEEGDYYCSLAVAIGVLGRQAEVVQQGGQELSFVMAPGSGSFTVLVSSAASFDRNEKIDDRTLALLDAAVGEGFAGLLESNWAWWRDFWSRGFVWLHSADGTADMIQQHYLYYLYLMASTSRGKYPTKFNGMLWITGGDERQWGGQYWGANQSCLYNGLFPSNRLELLDPMFDMYTGMYDACATAARQQWGSQGVFLPETHAFDGLAELPEEIAAEMRDLYLVRKPISEASAAFIEFSKMRQPHSSRWNWWESGRMIDGVWTPQQRPEAPFGAVTHIFSRSAKIAYMFWQRYEYTHDEAWLRERAYPMLRGVAEFYRNFPNTLKGDDGKYHIHHVNSNESVRDARDTDEEIAGMRGIFPALIRASEILDVDADMQSVWQEFLANLAPLPRSDHPDAGAMRQQSGRRRRGDDDDQGNSRPYWIRALPPIRSGGGLGRPDGNTMPMWFFDLCTLENPDEETMAVANATLDGYGRRGGGVLSKVGVVQAMMGRADAVRTALPAQLNSPDRAPVMANRMDQREGRQTTSAQRLGRAADVLHNALVQSVGAGPAAEPVIRVFPAWPAAWDAAFTLLCRGGFLVTSSMRGGAIEFVAVKSQVGGECRVRNPWGEGDAMLYRGDAEPENLNGSLLRFATRPGESVVLVQPGASPQQFKRALPVTTVRASR